MTIGVLVVDDQAPFRRAARDLLARLGDDFVVVGEAVSGEEAVELAVDLHPSLVLMDLNMPGAGGIDATRRITSADPSVTVILCSTCDADELPGDAATSGAKGYVQKDHFGVELLRRLWAERDEDAFVIG